MGGGGGGIGGPRDPLNDVLGRVNWPDLGLQIGLGSAMGFCSGYALKKIGKVAAFGIGTAFILVQVGRYYGVIGDIDWSQVEERMHRVLDADGDGRFTMKDAEMHYNKVVSVLSYNIPSSASFGAAFLVGLRYG